MSKLIDISKTITVTITVDENDKELMNEWLDKRLEYLKDEIEVEAYAK